MRISNLVAACTSLFMLATMQTAIAQSKLTFRCTLGPGTSANWDSGSVAIERGNFGKPTVVVTFDSIDLSAGTGRVIGNAGASDLVVLSGSQSFTLVEQTGTGNYVFTTIFQAKAHSTGEYIAVMSRHMATPSGPFPSQYHGTCTRL